MGEWFKQLPGKIVEFWNKYTAKQKTLFFSIAAAVLITLIALIFLLNRTVYTTLATYEDTASAAEAANLLEENGYEIKISDDALTIEVAEDQLSRARLLLGENGITSISNNTDYNWLFDNGFNTTDSEKKLKAKITLQSDMEMDIRNIEGITKASVTINIPESTSSIYNNQAEPSVSIMITVNNDFKEESALTIAEYAKTSVGAKSTDNITIIDNKGNLLFSESTTTINSSNAVVAIKQQVEEYYNSKLWNLMVNSGAYDEVSVSANLDVNVSDQHIQDIKYYTNMDDEHGPLNTHYYYVAENIDGTGGVVGTDANGEEITDYDLLDDAYGESTLTLLKEDYMTSSTTTTTVTPVGEVNMANSSMAMYLTKYQVYEESVLKEQGLLDDISFEEFKAANAEAIETINDENMVAMLSNATGIKEANIYVVERVVPIFYPAEKESVPVKSIISIVLAVIIGLLLLFVVFRSMKPEEVVELEPELSVEALLATTKENQTLDDIEFSENSASKLMIEKFVDENPEAVAALLRNWLNDDWE
ncbi:MAG: hypothetical protein E7258_05655 [Lachnospiraceae bacterium]|nr:hypothetical protein [Lachnospiraceae bacterium]